MEVTPRWVKVSWTVAALVLILVLVVFLLGGDHGPGRHSAPETSEHPSLGGESP
jgi:hypothetical protein